MIEKQDIHGKNSLFFTGTRLWHHGHSYVLYHILGCYISSCSYISLSYM